MQWMGIAGIAFWGLLVLKGIPLGAEPDAYRSQRLNMVEKQLKGRDIQDPQVLEVMARVQRHLFVPTDLAREAYSDHPLPIGEGQTISQPYIVALMTQLAKVKRSEKVLEIGTGSGYQAAVLAELTGKVFSIEIRPRLAQQAQDRLKAMGYDTVRVRQGDGYYGWPEEAPFDVIMITAAVNHIPPPLIQQLGTGGRLILPLGSTTFFQTLTLVTKKRDGQLDVQHLTTVSFVPMVGEAQKR
ncbi:MAG TPA: protein-L-isoaspartate(D-aspartate) O-methyltransferase [Nitrospiria bacterium]|nr:protein-L-isoaspartate(D-aspartate) O-methyltransferase [Nitrospiria bacterium]